MNIILIGYRGCGKTTIGNLLAARLWKTFVDVDQEACQRFQNDSIADIWQKQGEKAWRQMETEVTRELCARENQIIALGGGTLMQPPSRQVVEAATDAVRIYLKCDAEELHRRVSADQKSAATRPNLTNLGGGLEEIRAVLAQREPVYLAVADKVLDVTHLAPPDAVRYLIDRCL